MAKANKNSRDGFAARVGNTVTYKRMGKWVTRTIGISNKPASLEQLKHRQRIRMANEFIVPVKEFIQVSLAQEGKSRLKTPHDLMLGYILNNDTIIGEYPNQEIDFSKVQFSAGRMTDTPDVKAIQNEGGLYFSWDTALIPNHFRNDDQVLLLIYFPELQTAEFEIVGINRSRGSHQFDLDQQDTATRMETYISFISANGKRVSKSTYLGKFILPAYQEI